VGVRTTEGSDSALQIQLIVPINAFRSNKLELMGIASYFYNPLSDNHAHHT